MANVLLAWEFGGGLGHLLTLEPIARALKARGHKVAAAFRDLSRVAEVFSDPEITFIQAPSPGILPRPSHPPRGFTDVLAGVGFGYEDKLNSIFAAWNLVFERFQSDLLIADYAPFALLASHGRAIRRAHIGVPLLCPPDAFPLPSWAPGTLLPPMAQQMEEEKSLCQGVNRVLNQHSRPSLRRLGDLFNQVDALLLATYAELDPFGPRDNARYWGHWNVSNGVRVAWPIGSGAKIFTYLKPFAGLEELLRQLVASRCPTIVVSDAVSPELQTRYNASTILFEQRPLDMNAISRECDLAIFHAGHGTIASMLLAGKPCLLFPQFVEQAFNGQAVVRLGAGRCLELSATLEIGPTLRDMLTTDRYRRGAERFAARYRRITPGDQIPKVADALENLVSKPIDSAGHRN